MQSGEQSRPHAPGARGAAAVARCAPATSAAGLLLAAHELLYFKLFEFLFLIIS